MTIGGSSYEIVFDTGLWGSSYDGEDEGLCKMTSSVRPAIAAAPTAGPAQTIQGRSHNAAQEAKSSTVHPSSNPSTIQPSPGSWRHPQFDEIARRQRAVTFVDGSVHRIVVNGLALIVLLCGCAQ